MRPPTFQAPAIDSGSVEWVTDRMIIVDDALSAVMAVARAAVNGDLLADVDSLSRAVRDAGWTQGVEGGCWYLPGAREWSLLSSARPPSLAVFYDAHLEQTVYEFAHELVRRFEWACDLERCSLSEWPDGSLDFPRRKPGIVLAVDWMRWQSGPAALSLTVWPSRAHERPRTSATLHFQLERLTSPSRGEADGVDLDRCVAEWGSDDARWHLAGATELSDDVVVLLEGDSNPTVVAAVRAGASIRAYATAQRLHGS